MAVALARQVETPQQRWVSDVPLIIEPTGLPGVRALDLIVGVPLLTAALPTIAALTLVTKLTSPGQSFVRTAKLGQGGRPFDMLQFRTTDENGTTRWGRLLRSSGLADLPMLINVVRGTMSFVGPRPVTAAAAAHPSMMGVPPLALKPGWTGPWRTRPAATARERAQLDRTYTETRTMAGDIRLLARTVKSLVWSPR